MPAFYMEPLRRWLQHQYGHMNTGLYIQVAVGLQTKTIAVKGSGGETEKWGTR